MTSYCLINIALILPGRPIRMVARRITRQCSRPGDHLETIVWKCRLLAPPSIVNSAAIDGSGDTSLFFKVGAKSAPEGKGEYFIGLFLGASFPSESPPNGAGHTVHWSFPRKDVSGRPPLTACLLATSDNPTQCPGILRLRQPVFCAQTSKFYSDTQLGQ